MTTDPVPIIAFRGVTKRFGKRVAVESATFALRAGTTLGIVGESGSGKSTCVRLAIGLERPTEGEMLWHGTGVPAPAVEGSGGSVGRSEWSSRTPTTR